MKAPIARLSLLALSIALFATACSPEAPAQGQATEAPTATARAGDRVSVEISGAGASFVFVAIGGAVAFGASPTAPCARSSANNRTRAARTSVSSRLNSARRALSSWSRFMGRSPLA